MRLENIYNLTKEQFTKIVESDIKKSERILNIMEMLYRIEKKEFKKSKLLDYMNKYYKAYKTNPLDIIKNKKFLEELTTEKEKVFTVNLEYLSKKMSEYKECEYKFICSRN